MDVALRFGVDDGHRNALEQAQSHEPLFVILEAVVFVRERGAIEYPLGIHEIKPVVLQVALALNLVPRKPHATSVYS